MLAAFALPTLKRGAAAAIDWFSVFFFTIAVATGWVFYVAMQTGMPAKLAANVAKLSPGFEPRLLAARPSLLRRAPDTLAWLWLVRWRTGRNRHPLWKSLVLPAGGVSAVLAAGDDAVAAAARLRAQLPLDDPARRPPGADRTACIAAPGMPRAAGGRARVPGRLAGRRGDACQRHALRFPAARAARQTSAWRQPGSFSARERRNRSDDDIIDIYRRAPPA